VRCQTDPRWIAKNHGQSTGDEGAGGRPGKGIATNKNPGLWAAAAVRGEEVAQCGTADPTRIGQSLDSARVRQKVLVQEARRIAAAGRVV